MAGGGWEQPPLAQRWRKLRKFRRAPRLGTLQNKVPTPVTEIPVVERREQHNSCAQKWFGWRVPPRPPYNGPKASNGWANGAMTNDMAPSKWHYYYNFPMEKK